MSTELTPLESAVNAITQQATVEQIAEVLDKLAFMGERIRELKAELKRRMEEYVETNGEIRIGTKLYYLGVKRERETGDKAQLLVVALNLADGDMDVLARDFLAADPFKKSAFKSAVTPEEYDQLFPVVEKTELKDKPARELIEVDTRFVK